MSEKLQKRISTTFKLHGFSLRRLYLLFLKHSVNYSFEFPFGINNVTKIKHAKECKCAMSRLKRPYTCTILALNIMVRDHLKSHSVGGRTESRSILLM